MEEAAHTRRAAREALSDVDPEGLRGVIDGIIRDGSMTPGALTLLSARAIDGTISFDNLAERAAGVQLIYDGLRLTRTIAREEPWATTDDGTEADLDVLAVNVLVSRGFYLLATTEAAEQAVETIRAFGRDQTRLRVDSEGEAVDGLERDVLELAVIAGTTAAGGEPTPDLLGVARRLADETGSPLPAAELVLSETADDMAKIDAEDDGIRPSATDS